ncbi:GNAT family N-acetyltransferase [Aliivibrio kagoshimensis]|uniref:GNAT family N-acetyltransferase n=1 Tax=Aliivibrio kagoshimensis TaxID=2910230 RepID=UPI003D13D327
MRDVEAISCELFINPDREWLAEAWKGLETKANENIFLSWLWISSWLDTFVGDFILVEARANNGIVGLGILIKQTSLLDNCTQHGNSYLHRMGDESKDQIWIEYNDFLMDKTSATQIRECMASKVFHTIKQRESFIVGASFVNDFDTIHKIGVLQRVTWRTTAYGLDLSVFNGDVDAFTMSLSRSSRYQIKRSIQRYEALGELKVETALTVSKAMEFFDMAKPYHISRWGSSKGGSGFINTDFVGFHSTLIERGIQHKNVQIHRLSVNETTIAIIYNLETDTQVYFYLSAINYTMDDSHLKPGLVSHYLLIKKAIEEGKMTYDFMGGAARYKSTFANQQSDLAVFKYQHPHFLLTAENFSRKLKRHVQSKSSYDYS